jgi:hypothetical protein
VDDRVVQRAAPDAWSSSAPGMLVAFVIRFLVLERFLYYPRIEMQPEPVSRQHETHAI